MKYIFPDGAFTFHTATYGSWANDKRIIFRVREDNTPKQRAKEKGIRNYDRIVPSTLLETICWIQGHHPVHFMVLDIIE